MACSTHGDFMSLKKGKICAKNKIAESDDSPPSCTGAGAATPLDRTVKATNEHPEQIVEVAPSCAAKPGKRPPREDRAGSPPEGRSSRSACRRSDDELTDRNCLASSVTMVSKPRSLSTCAGLAERKDTHEPPIRHAGLKAKGRAAVPRVKRQYLVSIRSCRATTAPRISDRNSRRHRRSSRNRSFR